MSATHPLNIVTGTLLPRPPFDFAKTLSFLYGFGPTEGEQALASDSVTKAVTLHGRAIAFEVSSTGGIREPRLAYTLFSEHSLDEEEHAAVVDRLRFFLSLDDDLQPFYSIGQADANFA